MRVEPGPGRSQHNGCKRSRFQHRRAGLVRLPARQRPAGRQNHLKRPGQSLQIDQPVGRVRIKRQKCSLDRFDAALLRKQPAPGADIGGNIRHLGKSQGQRPEVQSRPTDNNRAQSCCLRLGKALRHTLEPGSGGERLGRWQNAIEPVRNPSLIAGIGTRRDKPQFAIELHGIRVDDDAIRPFGQLNSQGRLAAGGRPGYQDRASRIRFAASAERFVHVPGCHARFQSGQAGT